MVGWPPRVRPRPRRHRRAPRRRQGPRRHARALANQLHPAADMRLSLPAALPADGRGDSATTYKELAMQRTLDAVSAVESLPRPTSTRFLAYDELKEATNNFEASSVLGEGGFGRVYKGILSDGTAVAIKKLTSGGHQGDKEFLVEVEMLSRLHHRNLVKLIGYYSNRELSQSLLCYELVPNGSLEAWLLIYCLRMIFMRKFPILVWPNRRQKVA